MSTKLRAQWGTIVRNILVAAVLSLLPPTMAQANSIPLVNCNPGQVCIQNQGGSATTNGTGTSRTFSLSGATVTVIGSMIQPAGPPGCKECMTQSARPWHLARLNTVHRNVESWGLIVNHGGTLAVVIEVPIVERNCDRSRGNLLLARSNSKMSSRLTGT